MSLGKRCGAEFFGTFWLVFGGCGSAVLAAAFPSTWHWLCRRGAGLWSYPAHHGVRHRSHFGLPYQSGCFRRAYGPADGFPLQNLIPYIIAQVLGGAAASTVLYFIASGKAGFDLSAGFAANGYADHSPGGYSLGACLLAEIVLTFFFLFVILGATHRSRAGGLRRNTDRPQPHPYSPDRHTRGQPLGEPCSQHRARSVRAWVGAPAALALLGCPDYRRRYGRARLLVAFQRRIES